ncbi:MAG TPA: GreA/GreB family elongation factor [Candidatus Paceibacterota bacterium]|nr:GreA/GreB family elongation factor [Candidatus Paceibacterota bacterium]
MMAPRARAQGYPRASRDRQRDDDDKEPELFHVTQEGLDRLQERLAHLKRTLPARAEEARRTAAYGDRSENDEYKTAKGALRRAKWQILSIEDQLKRTAVIKPGSGVGGVVAIGSTVTLEFEGGKRKFEILGPHETDPTNGRISYLSPLGAAVLGKKKGDAVEVKMGDSVRVYKVVEVG